MLKITLHEQTNKKLMLEGLLAGPWVMELRAAVTAARTNSAKLELDLSGLRFMDTQGRMLLQRLTAEGVVLCNASPFIQEFLAVDG